MVDPFDRGEKKTARNNAAGHERRDGPIRVNPHRTCGEARNIDFRIRPVLDDNGEVIYLVPEGYDITERLRAEESLRKSEEKYRTFFQNSCDPMFILLEGVVIDCNAGAALELGYDNVSELLGLRIAKLSPEFQLEGERSVEKAEQQIEKAVVQGTHRFEWIHLKKNGDEFFVEVSLTAMPAEGKTVLHGVWRNITDRKRAEASLRRQSNFDTIITRILSLFTRCSATEVDDCIHVSLKEIGQFVGADSAYVTIGLPDRTAWSVTHNWVAPGITDYIDRYQNIPFGTLPWVESKILDGEIVSIEDVSAYPPDATIERNLFERDGAKSGLDLPLLDNEGLVTGSLGFRTYVAHTNWNQEDYPRLKLMSGAIANVLERKRAEESLQSSEERYRGLVSTMKDIAYLVSSDGIILFVGPPQVERYGYAVEEMISRPLIDFIFPEDRDVVWREFQHTLKTGEEMMTTFRFICKDGKVVWFEEMGRAVRDTSGDIVSVSGMMRDITERMRTIELENQLQQAQKMEAIGTLASGIAHDFNNILSAIVGYTQLSQLQMDDNKSVTEYLDEILKARKRAGDLVQQILTFGRQTEPERKPVSVNLIVVEVLKLLRASLPATIELKQNLTSESLIITDFHGL